jgi:hypothetical protein
MDHAADTVGGIVADVCLAPLSTVIQDTYPDATIAAGCDVNNVRRNVDFANLDCESHHINSTRCIVRREGDRDRRNFAR